MAERSRPPGHRAPPPRRAEARRPAGGEWGLADFLDSIPEATLIVGPDGYIEQANVEAAEVFGYPLDDLIGLEVEALLPESARNAHRRLRTAFMQAPRDRSMGRGLEIVGQRRDGSRFPADVELRPRVLRGGGVVLAVVRDLSKPREHEHVLRVRELERRLHLSRLAADDLDSLLWEMLGCLDRLGRGQAGAETLGSPLQELRSVAAMARDLVAQLSDYASESADRGSDLKR